MPMVAGLDNAAIKTHPHALPNAASAVVSRQKVFDYALNPDHPIGKEKARVFESALGFNASNGQELINQIFSKVAAFPAVERMETEYGRSFRADIPVTGPGGSGIVITGWVIDIGTTVPRLATLRVAKKVKNVQ
ncbi:MAG: DUF6883 domain-containing protein [Rhodoferax sp.]